MSRIGNRVLIIPEGVNITIQDNVVTVNGPKGTLTTNVTSAVSVNIENNNVITTRINETKPVKQMHGTANSNIENAIIGVTQGFEKSLETIGVGYRFNVTGKTLTINAGYSHPVIIEVPADLTVTANGNNEITVAGINKEVVGEFAAKIRSVREPEPYKGKGIRYKGEYVRRKEGKKAA